VKATARIRVQKVEGSTLSNTRTFDTCDNHLTHFVSDAWLMNHKNNNFARVLVENIMGSEPNEEKTDAR
jgi:hypothetical protein